MPRAQSENQVTDSLLKCGIYFKDKDVSGLPECTIGNRISLIGLRRWPRQNHTVNIQLSSDMAFGAVFIP